MGPRNSLTRRGAAVLIGSGITVAVVVGLVWALHAEFGPASRSPPAPPNFDISGINVSVVGSGAGGVYAEVDCAPACPSNLTVPTTVTVGLAISVSSFQCPPTQTYEITQVSAPAGGAFSVVSVSGVVGFYSPAANLPISIPYCGSSGLNVGGGQFTVTVSVDHEGPATQALDLTVDVEEES
jgi:hypothetical protein